MHLVALLLPCLAKAKIEKTNTDSSQPLPPILAKCPRGKPFLTAVKCTKITDIKYQLRRESIAAATEVFGMLQSYYYPPTFLLRTLLCPHLNFFFTGRFNERLFYSRAAAML